MEQHLHFSCFTFSILTDENIDLAHNQLTDVPELFSMLHIRKVDLRYNQVDYLPVSS